MSDDKTMIRGIEEVLLQSRKHDLARQASAYLIVLSGANIGRMFKLGAGELVIGRSQTVDVLLDDEGISRKHAKVVRGADGSVKLVDLNSTNGTFHNGVRVESHALADGDKIQVGATTILKFSYQDLLEEEFQKQLYDSATRDGLTRIYNKRFFLERIREEFAYAIRHQTPLSLLLLDIDFFKRINDTYGHPAGDFVLTTLADRISDTIRTEDVFCRYGGEEFALIMRDAAEDKAFIFGERLRRLLQNHEFSYGGTKIAVTVSGGLATMVDANYPGVEEFIEGADKFLYRAKQSGRNRVEAKMLNG